MEPIETSEVVANVTIGAEPPTNGVAQAQESAIVQAAREFEEASGAVASAQAKLAMAANELQQATARVETARAEMQRGLGMTATVTIGRPVGQTSHPSGMTGRSRVLSALRSRPIHPMDIAREADVPLQSVYSYLSTLKKEGKASGVGGKWRLAR